MYTEKSVELKTDFYSRYGEADGELYFERVGVPCVLMDSGTHALAFALGCGVRAYGRKCGNAIRILNDRTNVSDVHFIKDGCGAQILYSADVPAMPETRESAAYAIEKLLRRMGVAKSGKSFGGLAAICDRYGSGGWCAYASYDELKEIPMPMKGYNVILIRIPQKKHARIDRDDLKQFCFNETRRINAAAEGLKKCRMEVLFDMLNESEAEQECLIPMSENAVSAVRIAMETDGVCAARVCDIGVVCFCKSDMTDSSVHIISNEYSRAIGFAAGIMVVS